jgi:hypothetical protein
MKLLFGVVTLLLFQNAFSQKTSLMAKDKLIRINVSGLLDPIETNISGGLEYRLKDNVAISLDAGYIFYSNYYQLRNGSSSGFLFRPAIRYYTDKDKRFYIEAELHFKTVTTKLTDWLGKDCVNNVMTYEEFTDFKVRKNVIGLNLKFGYQIKLSKNDKLWLEPYFGLGIKQRREFVLNEPMSCYRFGGIFNRRNTVTNVKEMQGSIPVGLRFMIKI